MTWETTEEEIRRLESERHGHSTTFANTDPGDTVTRKHLQDEMDQRTERIRALQNERDLGLVERLILWGLATATAWGAWEAGPWWLRLFLGLLTAGLLLISF